MVANLRSSNELSPLKILTPTPARSTAAGIRFSTFIDTPATSHHRSGSRRITHASVVAAEGLATDASIDVKRLFRVFERAFG